MAPLNALTGGPKSTNRTPIAMGAVEIKAYDDTIAELANATTLAFENHQKPLCLYTDASDTHVGAVLQQESEEGGKSPGWQKSDRVHHSFLNLLISLRLTGGK